MVDPNNRPENFRRTRTMEISENREMYLLSIASIQEDGREGPVPLHFIAEEMEIMPVSVNEMIRKLSKEGFVRYIPYKGVELLAKGRRVALNVLRRRRLWEVFFVEKLGLSSFDADSLACRMEHITPAEVADRLCEYLGRPLLSPQGKPIPSGESTPAVRTRPFTAVEVGEEGLVIRIQAEGSVAEFLAESGIHIGSRLRVLALGSRGDLLLEVSGHQLRLGRDIANLVLVADKEKKAGSN